MKKIRVIVTALAVVMVLGSTLIVSADTNTTYAVAFDEMKGHDPAINRLQTYRNDEEKAKVMNNEVAEGDYYDHDLYYNITKPYDAFTSEIVKYAPADNRSDPKWNDPMTDELEASYRNLQESWRRVEATKIHSDGSNVGKNDTGSTTVNNEESNTTHDVTTDSTPASSQNSDTSITPIEEQQKKMQEEHQAVMTKVDTSVTSAINNVTNLVATGNASLVQAAVSTGVTVDTSETKWLHSLNVNTYENIEKATLAGIPVTIRFFYAGTKFEVTIPAGARVSDLCFATPEEKAYYEANKDRLNLPKPWCGFLNLTAHYGFKVVN